MARLPTKQYQELLNTMERVKRETVEPTPGIPLKRLRQVRFTEIFPKPRKFNLLAPSFLARVEEKLRESGCSVVVSRKTKTDGRLVIFNDGTKAPVGDNRPVIVDVDEDKMVLTRQGDEGRLEFIKGPDVSGRWGAGRDWIISNATRLLLGEERGEVAPEVKAEITAADNDVPTESAQAPPVQPPALQVPAPQVPLLAPQVQPTLATVVKEEAMEVVDVENVPPTGEMATQTVELAPTHPAKTRQSSSNNGEPMTTIREVVQDLRNWGQTLTSRAKVGGTPNPPVMRPPTPPLANLSPWLLRQRRPILEMIAGENKLCFWENSLGEFCYGRDGASMPSTSSAPASLPPHLIVSDVYMPSFIAVASGDYRLPVGSLIAKAEGYELRVWTELRHLVKCYFQE